jgi:hypothetical protein
MHKLYPTCKSYSTSRSSLEMKGHDSRPDIKQKALDLKDLVDNVKR